jgi:acetyl esterase/lipase
MEVLSNPTNKHAVRYYLLHASGGSRPHTAGAKAIASRLVVNRSQITPALLPCRFAKRLEDAGVRTEYREYAGQFHTFMHFGKVVARAVPALDETAASIAEWFRAAPPQRGRRGQAHL